MTDHHRPKHILDDRIEVRRALGRIHDRRARHRPRTEDEGELERLPGLLVSIVGHELRSPLQAIKASTAMLLERGQLDDADRRCAMLIASGALRMQRMIDQLLDITRGRTDETFPVHPEPTDLGQIVRGVVRELAIAHPRRTFRVVESSDTRGHWDPDRLAQVVDNLVGNANAYAPAGTAIDLELTGEPEDEEVALTVKNQGPPIPPAVEKVMFEPFRRGVADGTNGLGLGLFICKMIVEAHGGTIAARSDDDGTSLTVRLPRGAAHEPASSRNAHRSSGVQAVTEPSPSGPPERAPE